MVHDSLGSHQLMPPRWSGQLEELSVCQFLHAPLPEAPLDHGLSPNRMGVSTGNIEKVLRLPLPISRPILIRFGRFLVRFEAGLLIYPPDTVRFNDRAKRHVSYDR